MELIPIDEMEINRFRESYCLVVVIASGGVLLEDNLAYQRGVRDVRVGGAVARGAGVVGD